ncbi:hypothetical protein OG21DRAFT_1443188 [Imleria badia]|nr:hypothetical protein OG21DRAFT_1443188 [Imleria badia]
MAALRHDKLVALPSLSCALSSLPQATSLDSVSLHPSMYAQHAAESEAKLRKVLSKTASTPHSAAQAYTYVQSVRPVPPPIRAYLTPPRQPMQTRPTRHRH